MSLSKKRPRIFIVAIFFSIISASILWFHSHESDKTPIVTKSISHPESSPPPAPEREVRAPKSRISTAGPIVDSEETWDIGLAGNPCSIKLALDEACLRDRDGKDTIHRLVPPATQEMLPARLAQLAASGGVFPVAYLVGEERSVSSRRIITPDLRVQLDREDFEKIASQNGLKIKDRPDYAPGWVILSAGDAFAALDAMIHLRAAREVTSADVLLAMQHSPRALPNDPLVTNQWHLKRSGSAVVGSDMNIEGAWNYPAATGSRGAGIRIGVIDDGLQTAHPDLAPNTDTVNDRDWNGNDFDPNPGAGDDHGTACAGNAAAKGNNGIGVSGSAPDATLVGMRLIAAATTDAQEAEAMAYLPQLIEIKSNSWGPNDTGTLLDGPGPLTLTALQTATTSGRGGKGSIILWAGGNGGDVQDNSNYDGYANSIYTIAIGATDSAGRRAYYSEPGSNLVVCAPSSGITGTPGITDTLGITTTDRTGTLGYNTASTASGGDYANSFGGTSSATPSAAGVVALMLEKNPNLGWRDVQEILIRTAARPPGSTGWITNPAGIAFNHDFGAGLINATAAVNLAATWVNLPAQTSTTANQTGLTAAIPNNNTTGVSRSFDLSTSNIRVEHVTLTLSANHTARGNLQITLTSPGGMSSTLAAVRSDSGDNYSNWTFSTVRNWGELSTGTWTLNVADLSATGNTTGGTLTAASLKIFGTPGTPVNPPPLVQITQPGTAQVFSPGTPVTINVTATDRTVTNAPGSVTQVEFFANDISLGTDTTAPYSFTYTPTPGNHTLIAKATDNEAAIGTSSSVNISVINQAPVITAATLSASGQSFSDVPLTVSSITATDPENAPLSYSYQWQSSINQTVFTDEPAANSNTSPPLAGKLLRCVITASDGNSNSQAFTTEAVNLLPRPSTTTAVNTPYSYSSGLVLRGTDSPLSRQAIIHEFSQGSSSTSEWVEILTLKSGSLAFWDLTDAAGNMIVFLDDPVWDDIPAGTLIVVYNGDSRDPLLPADDLDPRDGRMIVSSTNPSYFDATFDNWIPLGNSGDSIFLSDPGQVVAHSLAYGNSVATTPNVGSVGSGRSAYFTGDTDSEADLAANWRTTSSTMARNVKTTRALGDLFISEYVEGSGNNKALEIYNPSASPVNLTTDGYKVEIYLNGATTASSTTNLTGTLLPGATFVIKNNSTTGTIAAVTAQLSSGNMNFNGDDAILLKKGTLVVDSFGQVGFDPGTAWNVGGVTTSDKTLRRKSTITQGDPVSSDAFNPSLEWDSFNIDTLSGLGSHSVGSSGTNGLTLTVNPATFAENLGAAAATATVSIPAAVASPVTVTLTSSDTGEFTVPATVTIAAGQTSSPSFAITAVDDLDSDGPQTAILSATAPGYQNGSTTLTITDNEPSVEGVTPAAANNAENSGFVAALRSGSLNSPALFRAGVGAVIPAGLTLDPGSGVLSGTIDPANPVGPYLIVIERYNSLGETISQSFTLTVTSGSSSTFNTWVGGFPSLGDATGLTDDFDRDGLPNGIENLLGTAPDLSNPGLTQVSATATTLVFQHSRSNTPASDLTPSYEWSSDLTTWNTSASTVAGTTVTFGTAVITDTTAPANDLIEVTATLSGTPAAKIFVRLKAVK
jgi:subtilisin-like proprotein convertase family protein